jgi:hypothetical protein
MYSIPVDYEKTHLNTLEKIPDLFADGTSVCTGQSPDGGQPSDYINNRCIIGLLKQSVD